MLLLLLHTIECCYESTFRYRETEALIEGHQKKERKNSQAVEWVRRLDIRQSPTQRS